MGGTLIKTVNVEYIYITCDGPPPISFAGVSRDLLGRFPYMWAIYKSAVYHPLPYEGVIISQPKKWSLVVIFDSDS